MQVFQTAGDPPNKGSKIFPNRGCSTNISEALVNKVAANRKIRDKLRLVVTSGLWLITFIGSPWALIFNALMIKHLLCYGDRYLKQRARSCLTVLDSAICLLHDNLVCFYIPVCWIRYPAEWYYYQGREPQRHK